MRSYNRLTQAVLRRPVELGLDAPMAAVHRQAPPPTPGPGRRSPCSSASSAKSLRSELSPRPLDLDGTCLVPSRPRLARLRRVLARRTPVVTDGAIGTTAQIGSTPYASRWASMNATITSLGGRAPPGRNTPTPSAGSRSLAATRVLPLELLEPLRSSVVSPGRWPASRSACRTQLRNVSAAQPIFSAIERDRRPLRGVRRRVLEHHPHRSLPHFRGKPTRSRHGSILSRIGASGEPGAVHVIIGSR